MKISKKIFACVLTVCMLLTMFAGVLSASAAVAGSATIGSVEIAAGANAEVPVTLTADAAIGGADLYIAFPEDVTVSAAVVTAGYSLEYLVEGTMAAEGNVDIVDGVAHFVLLASDDAFTGAATVQIVLTVAGAAEGENEIAFADGTLIGTVAEVEVAATLTNGAITVIAEAVCDHAETTTTEEVTKEATCAEAGSKTVTVTCNACSEVISQETVEIPATGEHDYTDGVCGTCGAEDPNYVPPVTEPEVVDSIVVRDAKISITATLDMIIRVRKTVIPADCVRAEIVVTPTIYDASYNPTEGTPFKQSYDMATVGNNLIIEPKNFSLFALDLPLYIQINCYNANDVLYKKSPVYTRYPADALKEQYIASPSTDFERKLDAIITDMLNMSAAAQKFFAGNASATAALKQTVESGNLVNKDWPQDYATTTEPEYNTNNSIVYGEGFNSTDNELRVSADLSGAPITTYQLRKAIANLPDTSKLTMTVSYTTYYGKAAGGEVVSDTITGDEWAAYVSGKHYLYKFSQCAMYDGNKTITVVVTYDGAEVVRCEYSLEAYIVANAIDDSDLSKCLRSMGIFGASARAYFGTQGTVDA